jgi:hypothetical protein
MNPQPPAGVAAPACCPAMACGDLRAQAERAEARLAHLRRQVREQLRDAVSSGDFDVDCVNNLLIGLDLPPLPRRWTVELPVTLVLTVVADSSDDAFDTAKDIVDEALATADTDIESHPTDVGAAIPGDIVDDPARP